MDDKKLDIIIAVIIKYKLKELELVISPTLYYENKKWAEIYSDVTDDLNITFNSLLVNDVRKRLKTSIEGGVKSLKKKLVYHYSGVKTRSMDREFKDFFYLKPNIQFYSKVETYNKHKGLEDELSKIDIDYCDDLIKLKHHKKEIEFKM